MIKKALNKLLITKYLRWNKDRYLDVHITDHCNLNCYGCGHFSPIADKYYIKLDKLEETYKKLKPIYLEKKIFNKIHLLGGEPLLHPDIENIIKLTRKYFPNIQIQIVTNGLKLPTMKKSFFNVCHDNNIKIYVSKYNINTDYFSICTLLKNNNINYELSSDREEFTKHQFDEKGSQNIKNSYKNCIHGGTCLQLRDDKIFPCAQAAYVYYINKKFNTKLEYSKGDYISLDNLTSKHELIKFILTPKEFCKYCDKCSEHPIKWKISKKQKEEWFNIDDAKE